MVEIKSRTRVVKNVGWRELVNRFVFVVCPKEIPALHKHFDCSYDDDGFMAFCYIDHDKGVLFNVIATGHIENDYIKTGKENRNVRFLFAIHDIENYTYVDVGVSINSNFVWYAEQSKKYDNTNLAISETRKIRELDAIRHGYYPDDIQVLCVGAGVDIERVWVRCSRIGKNSLYGILLTEPKQNIGYDKGDEINFVITYDKDVFHAVHIVEEGDEDLSIENPFATRAMPEKKGGLVVDERFTGDIANDSKSKFKEFIGVPVLGKDGELLDGENTMNGGTLVRFRHGYIDGGGRPAIQYKDGGIEFWTKGFPHGSPAVIMNDGQHEEYWVMGELIKIKDIVKK